MFMDCRCFRRATCRFLLDVGCYGGDYISVGFFTCNLFWRNVITGAVAYGAGNRMRNPRELECSLVELIGRHTGACDVHLSKSRRSGFRFCCSLS